MNEIFLENCIDTLSKRKIEYDYVFCVPPDFNELDMHPKNDTDKYLSFLKNIFSLLLPKNNIITIAITDRKFNSTIITKHNYIIDIMSSLGYFYISQKIWCKSYKINLYRLNYSFVMSFAKKPYKQNHDESFEPDLWNDSIYSHQRYPYAIALNVVKRCVYNFTLPNNIVYDPFMGSATTAIACLDTKRTYIGSEIDIDYYNI